MTASMNLSLPGCHHSQTTALGQDYQFAVEADSSHSPNGERPGSDTGMRNTILAAHQLV